MRPFLSSPWTLPLAVTLIVGGLIGVLAGLADWSTGAVYGATMLLIPLALGLRIAAERRGSRRSHASQ